MPGFADTAETAAAEGVADAEDAVTGDAAADTGDTAPTAPTTNPTRVQTAVRFNQVFVIEVPRRGQRPTPIATNRKPQRYASTHRPCVPDTSPVNAQTFDFQKRQVS